MYEKERKEEEPRISRKKKVYDTMPGSQQNGGDQPQMWRVSGQSDASNYIVRLTHRAIVPG